MTSPEVETTSFPSLPNETVLEILEHLGDNEIYQLSLTCRRFHDLALPFFFARHNIREPQYGWIVLYDHPRVTLPAIRVARFVPEITQIHVYLSPGVERMFHEIHNLHALVRRSRGITHFKLYMSVVDNWVCDLKSSGTTTLLDAWKWKEAFVGLLEEVTRKNCGELDVVSGYNLSDIYSVEGKPVTDLQELVVPGGSRAVDSMHTPITNGASEPQTPSEENPLSPLGTVVALDSTSDSTLTGLSKLSPQQPTPPALSKSSPNPLRRLKWKIIRILRRTKKVKAPELPSTVTSGGKDRPPDRPSVKSFTIHSGMLLRPPFREWTIDMLNKSSPSAISLDSHVLSEKELRHILSAITIPELSEFAIRSSTVHHRDIGEFLCRHSALTSLRIDAPPIFPPPDLRVSLPNLKELHAHSGYILWFLQHAVMLQLSELTLCSTRNVTGSDYDHFDPALNALATLLADGPQDRLFTLNLRCHTRDGLDDWFWSHTSDPDGSVLRKLRGVRRLALGTYWHFDFTATAIETLPSFWALFPDLQGVEVADQTRAGKARFDVEFWKKTRVSCPELKTIQLNRYAAMELDAVLENPELLAASS